MSTDRLTDAQLDALVAEITATGLVQIEAKSTIKVYRNAIDYFHLWHSLRYGMPLELPTPVPVVLQFMVDHSPPRRPEEPGGGLPESIDDALIASGVKKTKGLQSIGTLNIRLSALSTLHRARGLPNPVADPVVSRFKARLQPDPAPVRPALTLKPLEAMLAACDDSLFGLRDRALLLFAWSCGGALASDVAKVRFSDLQRTSDGTYRYLRPQQAAGADAVELEGPIVAALDAWIAAAKITDGHLFRNVRLRSGRLGAVQANTIYRVVKHRAALAGLGSRVSPRSLRLGYVAESVNQGSSFAELAQTVGVQSILRVIADASRAEPLSLKEKDPSPPSSNSSADRR